MTPQGCIFAARIQLFTCGVHQNTLNRNFDEVEGASARIRGTVD
jgi:hypothetical protein